MKKNNKKKLTKFIAIFVALTFIASALFSLFSSFYFLNL